MIGSDYASMTEQFAIRAGAGGYQTDVKGNTDLNGPVIAGETPVLVNYLQRQPSLRHAASLRISGMNSGKLAAGNEAQERKRLATHNAFPPPITASHLTASSSGRRSGSAFR